MIKKQILYICVSFFFCICSSFSLDDNKRKEVLITFFGKEVYEKRDKRIKAFFKKKSFIQILKELRRLMDEHEYFGIPDIEGLFGHEKQWNRMTKGLLKLYPDFHDKADLQIKRLLIYQIIQEESIDLEKDLKKWPDLLTHFPRIFEVADYKIQPEALIYLVQNQNKDGSWGEKNKIHCTSIALLSYLFCGETPNSKMYGKSIEKAVSFLKNPDLGINNKSIQLYFWALCEFYNLTDNKEVLKKITSTFPEFKSSISKDFQKEPRKFSIQNQAIHAYQKTPTGNDYAVKSIDDLDALKDDDSLALNTVKRQWQRKYQTSPVFHKKLLAAVKNNNAHFIDDLLVGRYLFLEANNKLRNQLMTKVFNYQDGKNKYTLEAEFTLKEQDLLQKVYPFLILEFTFPMSYPSNSKADFPDDKKEGLDLVK